MLKHFKPLCLLTGLAYLLLAAPIQAQTPLKINTAFAMPLSSEAQDGLFDHLMQELFGHLDKQVQVQRPPAERALRYANAGIDDGDGPRIAGLTQTYPNLLQVPEKVLDVEFVAFTLEDLSFSAGSWESLKPYHVGIVKGWKILESNIQDTQSLIQAHDPTQLFEFLKEGRIQVAVIDRLTGSHIAEQAELSVNIQEPPFAVREMYLYLHKKHEDIIESVAANLKKMKEEGRYAEIMKLP
jgi:polar amino acid transport system substrate-binding protein